MDKMTIFIYLERLSKPCFGNPSNRKHFSFRFASFYKFILMRYNFYLKMDVLNASFRNFILNLFTETCVKNIHFK